MVKTNTETQYRNETEAATEETPWLPDPEMALHSPTPDGILLAVYRMVPPAGKAPCGVVQIAHGMVEHMGRYALLARFLAERGWIVAGNDHRGHGRTAKDPAQIGDFGGPGGFERMVEDCHALTLELRRRYPGLPLIFLGHSMGSFVAQRLVERYGESVDGLILSGSNGRNGLAGLGQVLARFLCRVQGAQHRSRVLNQLAFGAYNKAFAPVRTPFDWLSRDPEEVDHYMADPYCGQICTTDFYVELMGGIKRIAQVGEVAKVPKTMPIFIFSGEQDPVGEMGKGVERLADAYRAQGIADVNLKLYPEGRHESLHEINQDQVMADILAFVETVRQNAVS